jgi:hypothetical protein
MQPPAATIQDKELSLSSNWRYDGKKKIVAI